MLAVKNVKIEKTDLSGLFKRVRYATYTALAAWIAVAKHLSFVYKYYGLVAFAAFRAFAAIAGLPKKPM